MLKHGGRDTMINCRELLIINGTKNGVTLMKKVAIGFVVGLAAGVASTAIGLRGYAK